MKGWCFYLKKYKLAVVGATGVVGRTVLKVLQEKNLPISEYVFFASSKSAGKTIHFMEKNYTIKELTENSFDDKFDFAIFSAGGDKNMLLSLYLMVALLLTIVVLLEWILLFH